MSHGYFEPNLPASSFSDGSHAAGGAAWRHFMQSVLQCFREPRGPIKGLGTAENGASELDEDDEPTGRPPSVTNREKHMKYFEQLFSTMVSAPENRRNLSQAFFVTQFVCDHLEPEQWRVRGYLNRLVDSFVTYPPKGADSEAAPVAVLIWAAELNEQSHLSLARAVRGKLLRLGTDLSGEMPNISLAKGFIRLLLPEVDFYKLWQNILNVRTPQEEVKAYRSAVSWPLSQADFPFLSGTPEWETLKTGKKRRVRIMSQYSDICPFCYMTLPTSKASQLRQSGITNCCGRILLCEET